MTQDDVVAIYIDKIDVTPLWLELDTLRKKRYDGSIKAFAKEAPILYELYLILAIKKKGLFR